MKKVPLPKSAIRFDQRKYRVDIEELVTPVSNSDYLICSKDDRNIQNQKTPAEAEWNKLS